MKKSTAAHTKGFLRAAFISDNHARIYVKDTTVTAMGANPLTQSYQGYVNSADQNIMISPVWSNHSNDRFPKGLQVDREVAQIPKIPKRWLTFGR